MARKLDIDKGRIRHVEPTNLFNKAYSDGTPINGTYSDAINFPYENYSMAVDLSIKLTNRYSCGYGEVTNEYEEVGYSTSNGTLSFFGGTKLVDVDEKGYLTTNFTDISMVDPKSNTSETLGIESINITYNSWQYPQVVIKFIDVRGATVMQPAEQHYYNEKDQGKSSAIYKALFSFPYPLFTLKVKGFYGKGVTYKLAVRKTSLELDAASGNFNITAEFIGYMFGVYADMPMTFLAISPYTETGRAYWDKQVKSGVFTFKDSSGKNDSGPMLKIPELRLRLAQAANSEEAISAAAENQQTQNNYDNRLDAIARIQESYPFKDWLENASDDYIYSFGQDKDTYSGFSSTISGFVTTISGYDVTYGTNYMSNYSILEDYGKGKKKMDSIHYVKGDATHPYIPEDKWLGRDGKKKFDEYIGDGTEIERKVNKYIDKNRGSDTKINDFYIFVLPKSKGAKTFAQLFEELAEEAKKINTAKNEEDKKYQELQASLIEKAIGFRPSIRNIYNLAFAHMDTFIHTFYDRMKMIKDQLDGHDDRKKRSKTFYGVGMSDDDTDTERQYARNADGTVDRGTVISKRSAYLPPWTAFYEEIRDGSVSKKVLRWPGELVNADANLIEIGYVKELLAAAKFYADVAEGVEEEIEKMSGGTTSPSFGGSHTSEGVNPGPTPNVGAFIPLTTYDFVNKDTAGNPYYDVKSKVIRGGESIYGSVLGAFALRAFYYLCCNDTDGRKEARSFGILEAINFYKAVGDNVSMDFLKFIKQYADGKSNNSDSNAFLKAITSNESNSTTRAWQFDAPNTNNSLFKKCSNGDLEYNLYKTSSSGYTYYPIGLRSFETMKGEFVEGDENLYESPDYITSTKYSFAYKDGKKNTFFMFDRDCIKNIYASVEAEITKSEEYLKQNKEGYGDRKLAEFGKTKNKNRTLRNYENNIATKFDERCYKRNAICNKEEKSFSNGRIKKLLTEDTFSSQEEFYIRFPSMVDERKKDSLFDDSIYQAQTDIKSKAFLFLQSVPIIGKNGGIEEENENGISLYARLLREGSYYWRYDLMTDEGRDPINIPDKYVAPKADETFCGVKGGEDKFETIRMNLKIEFLHDYVKWKAPSHTTPSRRKILKELFIKWAESNDDLTGFAANEKRLLNINLYKKKNINLGFDIENLIAKEDIQTEDAMEGRKLQKFLRRLFFTVTTTFDYYNGIIGESAFHCDTSSLKNAFDGFIDELHLIYGDIAKDAKKNEQNVAKKINAAEATDPFKNKDLRLTTYMTLKSLYDKWLCAPINGIETWKLNSESGHSDFDNFVYADTFYHDIGYKLTVNISKVSNWLSSCLPTENLETTEGVLQYTGRTIFEFLSEVAQDSGGMLLALPQKFGIATAEDVAGMFTPYSINSDWNQDDSSFIFMYTYKPSEHLGDTDGADYDMNGWSRNGDSFNVTDDEIIGKLFSDNGYTIPSFGVTYAKQNQAIFKNITLNTEDAGVTEAGLAATFNIASKASEGPRESTIYGQDLYRVYSQYAYQCGVECMGNMEIMPLMYFQLNNVPLWKGTYMIKKVSHNITVGNISTQFEGVRVNKYAIPMTDCTVITDNDGGGTPVAGDGTRVNADNSNNNENNDINNMAEVNVRGDINTQKYPNDVIDFDENNVTPQKPVICLTPGHGPNTQKVPEWTWAHKMIKDYLVPELQSLKYRDGTPFNVQRCNKEGAHTGKGYSMAETKKMIEKFGSQSVVSVACHWNGGGGNYHGVYLNKLSNGSRQDSIQFAQYLKESFDEACEKGKNGEFTCPEGMTNGMSRVTHLSEANTDGGPQQNCACVLTENWFADYPKGCAWGGSHYADMENGKYKTGRGWLMSDEGCKVVAHYHALGIKRYIDSLWKD